MALKIKTETRQGNFHDELKISGRRSEWGGCIKTNISPIIISCFVGSTKNL